MKPPILIIIMATIMTGTMIVMLSSHWLLIWIGFEMNMLAIIPILMKKYNPRAMEASTKYFLTQATASMLLMMGVTINLLYSGQWVISKISNPIASIMMTTALTMKLGLSPFHFWVPEVTQGITLMSGMILLTWQKIAPMSILYQISPSINTNLLMLMALTSVLVGGWGGLNQTQLRKIMAYSSIAHMGWMAAIITYNPTMMVLNLTLYILMTLSTFMLFMLNSSTTTLSLSHMWNKFPLITSMILILMLSLGGLPPLSGFIPKWMIIQELTKNNMIIIPTLMAITALLNLYFYLRLTYSTALTMFPSTNNMKMKWQFEYTKKATLLPPLIITSTMLLPLTPMLSVLD
ncbi:NADH dehydrogenase subunit 2 (mitochondrion) [Canis lupus familiaris]|uniref:NADH-ubiquinone oxidoreductase chain 2 n=5 Tax=Canis lupus TaxID=9612 RepID=NU2M_CANLF|nr:NADH dehydrogenase subunit 2 [Canis lupus familiaris]Q9ZZ65.2 RecName: Full=NADH-ubiquinone oxidoreductase chain 2; AltName: Full=NADH dehydrogenase subunit 2 [Canis lupus familiaris]AHG98574.1 NADH dehydrogenase subunit 2 [Canis lupus]AWW03060.1 NADH dehydrogenase subunit 2 [Canis lupus dingo]AAD04764.2 NADH dehydrogenase subunit 2 [Canis lupus familiaris]AAT74127.1 NADH dehydrogenase subunit 2 [Canis lupus familiaris]AAT74140.1 NADH dehydrogenase subunit 2 [Canis lupus familiaris]|eukprot:NP_008472.4 NADH dehydrogenase subunit 2 (mitochondrion) [Canis lupus familiaris]